MKHREVKTLKDSVYKTTGPVLFDYVCWVLSEAKKRGIHTLYFLARDGYVLFEIAREICRSQELNIDCRYLYCSRTALRLPAYHLIGEEAYDLLLLSSYHDSMRSVLERIYITRKEREQIYEALGYAVNQEENLLSYSEFSDFTGRLRKHPKYREIVEQKSRAAYPAAMEYLRQEKLFEQPCAAIVDSGWSGSMQRCFRQLLRSGGYTGNITGFYFGMFDYFKKDAADGEFCCWYFDQQGPLLNKLLFCNNLFECILSAPHGMTLFYETSNGSAAPVLKDPPMEPMRTLIHEQITCILRYTEQRLRDFSLDTVNFSRQKKKAERLIRKLMSAPSKTEVMLYGQFQFSDDITDSRALSLAGRDQLQILKRNYLVLPRLIRKLTGKSKTHVNEDLFWPYGTAALSGSWLQVQWYRMNIFLWDLIRYWVRKMKDVKTGGDST